MKEIDELYTVFQGIDTDLWACGVWCTLSQLHPGIVVHGREMIFGIVPDSAKPFNFKEQFSLTEEEALEVSDHFPVEVDLKPNHRYLLRNEL